MHMPTGLRINPPELLMNATMAHIRARAQWMAWATYEAYVQGATSVESTPRASRAAMLMKARDYRRRAIRVGDWVNSKSEQSMDRRAA